MRTPTLVGARVPRARRHPTPARGSVVGRPAAPRAGDGPPGTSAPTILPPAPTSAPSILPPAPTWPLPLSHLHPHRPLPLSRPHPLGPDVGSTTARRAKYPRRPRRGTPTLSHPMRPSHARPVRRETLPQKSEFFFVIEGCRRHTFMCRASRGYAPRPIKQGESGVSGGMCAACIFFRGPLARTAAVWYTHGVFDHGRGFGWDVRTWVNSGRLYDGSWTWKKAQQVNHQVEREAGWPDGRTVKGRKPRK